RHRGQGASLPAYLVNSHWSDRTKVVERPLFPGYLFCRLDLGNRLPVLSAPGIIGILGFGKIPVPVPDEEIETIQTLIVSGHRVKPWPFLQSGERVVIESGPLQG